MAFQCEKCNYSTTIKCNFNKHLKTKKHILKVQTTTYDLPLNNSEIEKNSKFPHKVREKSINSLTNPQFVREKKYKSNTTNFVCDKCGKEFSREDNLKRHLYKYCNQSKEFKEIFKIMNDNHKKEKEELKNQIDMLLNKVGNNTTINNTIILNNYGNEDLSHITNSLKTQLLKIPYGMIPKMIEEVHFNNDKPENKNIMLTNSRDNKLKIYKNNKWIYKDKTEALNDLVDNKYFILDNHFDIINNNITSNLNEVQLHNYNKFRELIDNGDKLLIENIKKDCELLLLNNR